MPPKGYRGLGQEHPQTREPSKSIDEIRDWCDNRGLSVGTGVDG